jgi:hypothetical protein
MEDFALPEDVQKSIQHQYLPAKIPKFEAINEAFPISDSGLQNFAKDYIYKKISDMSILASSSMIVAKGFNASFNAKLSDREKEVLRQHLLQLMNKLDEYDTMLK